MGDLIRVKRKRTVVTTYRDFADIDREQMINDLGITVHDYDDSIFLTPQGSPLSSILFLLQTLFSDSSKMVFVFRHHSNICHMF